MGVYVRALSHMPGLHVRAYARARTRPKGPLRAYSHTHTRVRTHALHARTRTQGLTAAIHETGHSLYEMARNKAYDGLPVSQVRACAACVPCARAL